LNDDGLKTASVRDFCGKRRGGFAGIRQEKKDGNTYRVAKFTSSVEFEGHSVAVVDELWFDEGHNHLLGRYQRTGRDTRREITIDRFVFPKSGVAFPAVVSDRAVGPKGESGGVLLRLDNIRVNDPLPAGIFDLEVPAHATVTDEVTGKRYQTGADGKQVGPAVPLTFTPSLPNPPGISRSGKDAPAPTETEPQLWARFILPIGLGCLFLGSVLWFVRRWRRDRPAD
jgi:hypothetical protein